MVRVNGFKNDRYARKFISTSSRALYTANSASVTTAHAPWCSLYYGLALFWRAKVARRILKVVERSILILELKSFLVFLKTTGQDYVKEIGDTSVDG